MENGSGSWGLQKWKTEHLHFCSTYSLDLVIHLFTQQTHICVHYIQLQIGGTAGSQCFQSRAKASSKITIIQVNVIRVVWSVVEVAMTPR